MFSEWLKKLVAESLLLLRFESLRSRLDVWRSKSPVAPLLLSAPEKPLAYATVIIPALNEERRIGDVVRYALADPGTAEVIVLDDSSIDATADRAKAAGARVVTSTILGKGASMRDGVNLAAHEFVVYLDGDLAGLSPNIITKLCEPMWKGEADFVKAKFDRSGGRVTELTAKPMLHVFFPELCNFAQPLGGILAARKSLLQTLSFEDGFGVDVGLLLDAHLSGAHLAEVAIGSLEHESQPLGDLTGMANEVSQVIFNRARKAGRLHVDQISAMHEAQRQAMGEIEHILNQRKGRQDLLLIEMDGLLTPSRFIVELAKITGRESELVRILNLNRDDPRLQQQNIAGLFRFVHKEQFERVARSLEIRPEAIEFVNVMRRRGFMVGVISDSYFVPTDIVRRRVFADFALSHGLQFEADVCNGRLNTNELAFTKSGLIDCFKDPQLIKPMRNIWVLGNSPDYQSLMRLSDQGFVLDPKATQLLALPNVTLLDSLRDVCGVGIARVVENEELFV
jgi:glucosyl-3-phosphoglycerate synthase